MRKDYSDTTVIAPTLNEGENISAFVNEMTRRYPGIRLIVPDDGSADNTVEIIKRMARRNPHLMFLDRSEKKVHGVTASILDSAMLVKTSKIVSMDADFQHPPGKVGEIVDRLSKCDFVIGVRRGSGKRGLKRRVMSVALAKIAMATFSIRGRQTCSDMASGYFGIKTKLLKELISNDEGAFVKRGNKTLLDILRAAKRPMKMGEVEYPNFPERERGRSKFTARIIFFALESALR